jgi:hypothetical protein
MIKDLPWWRCGQDPRLGKVGALPSTQIYKTFWRDQWHSLHS